MYLLDTNVCLDFLLNRDATVVERLERAFGDCAISSIIAAELWVGNRSSVASIEDDLVLDRFLHHIEVLPFDAEAARHYGRLMRNLAPRRTNFDRLIAGHALALSAVLVTANVSDFSDVAGLAIEDWRQS